MHVVGRKVGGDRKRSPHLIAKPAIPRWPRHQADTRRGVLPCNFALTLRLRFELLWLTRLEAFDVSWLQLSKCLARPRLRRAGACRGRGTGLGVRNLRWSDRGLAGVENNALRPFPIGMNADDYRRTKSGGCSRQLRKTRIRDKEQREQHSANIEQISRDGHWSLHRPRRVPPGRQTNDGRLPSDLTQASPASAC